jgi:hypothetical protein
MRWPATVHIQGPTSPTRNDQTRQGFLPALKGQGFHPRSPMRWHRWQTAPGRSQRRSSTVIGLTRLCGPGLAGPMTPATRGARPVRLRSCGSHPSPNSARGIRR